MRLVIQRVKEASVIIDNQVYSEIKQGFLLYVGLHRDDSIDQVKHLAKKVSKLRIFSDENDLMNLNIKKVNGRILSISQFTLYGDTKKQNRPGFSRAMPYLEAEQMYDKFNQFLEEEGLIVKTGKFGENMQVASVNDGPVTIIIDSNE
jgi:D-tyrosyl-tRNA(Tyr) deacylase